MYYTIPLQVFIKDVLSEILYSYVISYTDNILIYSWTEAEYMSQVCAVLQILLEKITCICKIWNLPDICQVLRLHARRMGNEDGSEQSGGTDVLTQDRERDWKGLSTFLINKKLNKIDFSSSSVNRNRSVKCRDDA